MSPENPCRPFHGQPSGGRQTAPGYLAGMIRQQEARLRGLEALERLVEAAELTPEDDSALWSLFCAMSFR